MIKKCYVNVPSGISMTAITTEIDFAIRESGASEGVAIVALPDSGAGLIVVEPIEGILDDIKQTLSQWIVATEGTVVDSRKLPRHRFPIVGSALLSRFLSIPVVNGKLVMDAYDAVLLVNLESEERRKEVVVMINPAVADKQEKPPARAGR